MNPFAWWPKVSEGIEKWFEFNWLSKFEFNSSDENNWSRKLDFDWAWIFWNEINEEIQIPENIGSIPEFSIIEWLKEKWHIEIIDYIRLIEKLDGTSENKKEIISEEIDKTSIKLNWKEKINIGNFEKSDFYQATIQSEIQINLDSWISNLDLMLAENYIEIPNLKEKENPNKKDDIEQDINRSIDITLAKLLNKQSPDFKKNNNILIELIEKTEDIHSRYEMLKDIYRNTLLNDAIKFSKKEKLTLKDKIKAVELIKELINLLDIKVKLGMSKKWITKDETQKIEENWIAEWKELIKLWKEIWIIEEWILSWWDNDKAREGNESTESEEE